MIRSSRGDKDTEEDERAGAKEARRPRGRAAASQMAGSPPRGVRGRCYASTLMTTRRFWARPSLVLFGATGFSSP